MFMSNIYLDFRFCGFFIKRLYIFETQTYIDTISKNLPFKNNIQYDLKITLNNCLELSSEYKFIFNGLKTQKIKTKDDIFFYYKQYTIYVNNLNQDKLFNNNNLVSNSNAMQTCLNIVNKISRNFENIFIYGDTGVGKELISTLVHFNSYNNTTPFVVFNCALFKGYYDFLGLKKGSFSNACKSLKSVFEKAKNGILVLDNIDELDLKSQAILLRIVDNKYIKNLGSDLNRKLNLRIISITSSNPYKLLYDLKLRKDLFYRLSTYIIKVPDLIERLDDLDTLIDFYKDSYKLSYRALYSLKTKYYEGNLRELANLIDKLKINTTNKEIDISCFDYDTSSFFKYLV